MATDRNQQAREDFAAARQRKQFQDALTSGQAGVRDRFGVMLAEGDRVLFHPAYDLVAKVTKIAPVFDPRVPVGTMQIIIETAFPTQVMANQALSGVIKIMSGEEQQAPEPPPVEPPAEEPPAAGDDQPAAPPEDIPNG